MFRLPNACCCWKIWRLTVSLADLPTDWQNDEHYETLQTHLSDRLAQPNGLTVSVPSAIVSRSRNYLLHTLHPGFRQDVKVMENAPFPINSRLAKQ